MPTPTRCFLVPVTALLIVASVPTTLDKALAGGTAEEALLIIDPSNADSMHVGNYYKYARNLPNSHVLYIYPGAANYPAFAAYNLPALSGTLANRGITADIDYVVLAPGPFYVSAPGLVAWACAPVTRFSISSAYTMAFIADEILSGQLSYDNANRYYSTSLTRAFDSQVAWYNGVPSTYVGARRYYIGALLGYTGANGNTVAEILDMIDRSVAADFTSPAGAFYFMNNTADPARNIRASVGQYSVAVNSITSAGGSAQILAGVLPAGQHDCLGIMTGVATVPFSTTDLTILPGAFGDHLTSWAATFDNGSQTKVAAWIQEGASGSWGTVEEPCNYPGKFPHAMVHAFYYRRLSLGEAAFRSVQYTPFQGLLYGDPLTQPFSNPPTVELPDAPTEPVSGTIVLSPVATPGSGSLGDFNLLIDGVIHATAYAGQTFTVDTTRFADGWHDLRVVVHDTTLSRATGRWVGAFFISNLGRAVDLTPSTTSGDLTTGFLFDVAAAGGVPSEVRLMQNGRIVAAAAGGSATFAVYGLTFGAGPVEVHGEALFEDGRVVRSAPVLLDIAPQAGAPAGAPPTAFGFTKRVRSDSPFVVELPATIDDPAVALTYEVVTPPTKATVPSGQSGPYRLMFPGANAHGLDTFTFRATSAAGDSDVVTLTLDFGWPLGDMDCDGDVDFDDIDPFVVALEGQAVYEAMYPDCHWINADCDGDGDVDFDDIDAFVVLLG